jgi:hypothetical protein
VQDHLPSAAPRRSFAVMPTPRPPRALAALPLLVAALLTTPATARAQAPANSPGTAIPKPQLAQLRWISGYWRGEGTAGTTQAPFFERYRFGSDSVLLVDSFADSTFTRMTGTARYLWRAGRFANVPAGDGVQWAATRVDSTMAEFAPVTGTVRGFRWARGASRDQWTATILPPPSGGSARHYLMRRALLPADSTGVRAAAMDYIEGFYEGDSTKLVRSVRPDVAKYGFYFPPDSSRYAGEAMPFAEFLDYARSVRARSRPVNPAWPKEVTVLDVLDQTAAAKVRAWWGTDYLLLARQDGRWVITHVLWQSPSPVAGR